MNNSKNTAKATAAHSIENLYICPRVTNAPTNTIKLGGKNEHISERTSTTAQFFNSLMYPILELRISITARAAQNFNTGII
jgi:hypothetical protein